MAAAEREIISADIILPATQIWEANLSLTLFHGFDAAPSGHYQYHYGALALCGRDSQGLNTFDAERPQKAACTNSITLS